MNRYSRSGRRGYSSGFGARSSRPQAFVPRQARSIPSAVGSEIAAITLDQIQVAKASNEAEISDCQFVASYNLLEGLQKTILVPGRPPVWTPLQGTMKLSPDSGEYYRDENAARFPIHVMEPAVESIFRMNLSFDPSTIDVFGCGSTLGDILRFSMGVPQPFSFIVQIVGRTAFFLRRNHSPTELIDNVYGYGHVFPEAYTTWSQDVKGSASHQRIIEYSFGGLQFLVRFEADGYILDQADSSEDEEAGDRSRKATSDRSTETSTDDLVEKLLEGIITPSSRRVERSEEKLTVRTEGRRVPQSDVFDLKTRSSRKQRYEVMAEQLPRLWVRQIQQFVLAFHTGGHFDPPDVIDVTTDIIKWEQKSKTALTRMATLIKDIRDTVTTTGGGMLEVRGDESSTLRFHEVSGAEIANWDALPEKLRKQWVKG